MSIANLNSLYESAGKKVLLGAGKANPDITTFNPVKHYVRPVPQAELDVMENRDEYGQNPNY
jgi:hypothetical protein